jgi:hypothetical protein
MESRRLCGLGKALIKFKLLFGWLSMNGFSLIIVGVNKVLTFPLYVTVVRRQLSILRDYSNATHVWFKLMPLNHISNLFSLTCKDWIFKSIINHFNGIYEVVWISNFIVACWHLWTLWNNLIFWRRLSTLAWRPNFYYSQGAKSNWMVFSSPHKQHTKWHYLHWLEKDP